MTQNSLWLTGKRGGDNEKLVDWQCDTCQKIFQNDEEGEKHIISTHGEGSLSPRLNSKGHELWAMHLSLTGQTNSLNEPEKLAKMGYFTITVNQETIKLPKNYAGAKRKISIFTCSINFNRLCLQISQNLSNPEEEFRNLSISYTELTEFSRTYEIDTQLGYLGNVIVVWEDDEITKVVIEDLKPSITSPDHKTSLLIYIARGYVLKGIPLILSETPFDSNILPEKEQSYSNSESLSTGTTTPWMKSKPKNRERDRLIWELREEGHTWEEIAEKANCGVTTARYVYKRLKSG